MAHSRVLSVLTIDLARVETPAYVVDLGALRENLAILDTVQRRAGCKILLALKGFAMWSTFPIIREVLAGIAASSPDEARLGAEELGKEVHAYAPAYSEADIDALLPLVNHIIFNSPGQWRRHIDRVRRRVRRAGRGIECGLRINPEHSEVEVALYDPCAARSRLGTTRAAFDADPIADLDGIHFHTLCELGADALERTVAAVEARFADVLERVRWVNFGGGHHITRADYDVEALIATVERFRRRWNVEVILEPGEAIALDTGVLVAQVLDVVHNEMPIAILDTSATAHMPDVLEMPYRPRIVGAGEAGEHAHTYRLGGLTCLAGDVIGDYSFPRPLACGDRLVFLDMAHYSMVKNTTFNGVHLPSIATYEPDGDELTVVRRFGYEDYKGRLS